MILQPAYNGHRDCKDLRAVRIRTAQLIVIGGDGIMAELGYQIDPGRLQNQKRSKPTLSLCGGWLTISFTTLYIYIV